MEIGAAQFLTMRDIVVLSATRAHARNSADLIQYVCAYCMRGNRAHDEIARDIRALPGISCYGLALAVEERASCGLFGHRIEVCIAHDFDDPYSPSIACISDMMIKLRMTRAFAAQSLERYWQVDDGLGAMFHCRASDDYGAPHSCGSHSDIIIHIPLPGDVINASCSRIFTIGEITSARVLIRCTDDEMLQKIQA